MWVALVVVFASRVVAQPMGMGNPRDEKSPAVKSDLKYINCQSCEFLIREANRGVKQLRSAAKPGKQVTEADVFGFLEQICDPEKDEGEWIATIDLVETDGELKLVDMNTVAFCKTECRTIARACSDLIEEFDYDLAEALFRGTAGRAELTQRFCRELSSVCREKPPKLPPDRPEGDPFIPMTEDDYKMAKMMQQMKALGLGGQVFDQDSASQYVAERSGLLSDDDDEEIEMPKRAPDQGETQGYSFMDTVDWAKKEAGKKLASGIDAAQGVYDRVRNRFRREETEL